MEHEWHDRQQMNNLQMSVGVLRATTCDALNRRCQVKVQLLSKDELPKPFKPHSDLPKIPRKKRFAVCSKETSNTG